MSQPIMPQQKAQIGGTDVLGAYNLATNAANTNYAQKLAQQNALWGGLAGLGGSALTAGILRGSLFGGGAGGAAAAPAAASAAAPAAASAIPFASGAPVAAGYGATAGVPLAGLAPPAAGGSGALSGLTTSDVSFLDPAILGEASAPDAVAPAIADTAFDTGTAAVPFLGAGAAGAGSVAGDLAAAAPVVADAGADAAAAGGMTLADLLPFLFAA